MKALFVGRFQPLHKGHIHAINAAREQFGDVTLVVGSAQKYGTAANPLPVGQRIEMIRKEFPDIRIVTQEDVFNDREWIRQITHKTEFDIAITGNDWVRDCFRKFNHPVEEPEFYKPEKGRYLHPQYDIDDPTKRVNRPITHWEAARIQTFPDDFKWCGTKIEIARQIGNAVPPDLAAAIARHLRATLLER